MVTLEQDEREALRQLATNEKRDPRAQAALLIRAELERRGLLPINVIAIKGGTTQKAVTNAVAV